ncbi:MAG: DUF2202 domain-containing protein [Candidatus Nanopelagicales bacterium]
MKRGTKVAIGVGGGILAVAAVGLPAAAVVSSVGSGSGFGSSSPGADWGHAGDGDGNQARGNGWGMGGQMNDGDKSSSGRGSGGMGNSEGMGAGVNLDGVASGSLTAAQRTALAEMADEEKMAHDLYVALGDKFPDLRQFQMIPNAESRHVESVQALLARYSIADPTAGKSAGEFTSTRIQNLYDTLLAQGSASPTAALNVGVDVEKTDIADLNTAGKGVTAPDVTIVYQNLTTGSEHHLAAFSR